MTDETKKDYVLIERIGEGPSINGYDSFLCEWKHIPAFLSPALERCEPNEPYTVRFTYLLMSQSELVAYCEEHDIEEMD